MHEPSIFRHASGLRVIHLKKSEAPVVAVQAWVHVGSADEELDELGLAHVHEHMIFKGTERHGVGEIAAEIEAIGGRINAWTSFDETVYHIVVPARFAGEGMDVLFDALQHSTFEAEELSRELEVIQEEILRGEDNPARVLMQNSFSEVYRDHPYGRPVIGTSESVAAFTRDDILNFYRKWYQPRNMTAVVVGDIERSRLEEILDEMVEGREIAQTPRPDRAEEVAQKSLRTTVSYRDVQASQLNVIFPGPPLSSPDLPALEVLLTLLGDGASSLLYERLRREKQIVESVYAGAYTPKDPGMIVFGASFEADVSVRDPLFVLAELLREIDLATVEPFTREDVERAVRSFEASVIHQQQTVEGQAQRFGHFDSVAGNIAFDLEFLEKVRSLEPEDLLEVARAYFQWDKLTVGLMLPRSAEQRAYSHEDIETVVSEVNAQQKTSRVIATASPDEHGIISVDFDVEGADSPLRLLLMRDDSVPVFSVRALALGGQLHEPRPGSNLMLSKLLTSGTNVWETADLARRAEYLGLSLSGIAGTHSLGMSMSALTRDFAASMQLFESCLFESTLPQDEVERTRREMRRLIEKRRDNLSGSAILAFREAIYGEHVYARPAAGELKDVDAISRDELEEYMRAQIQPQRLVVGIVGDVEVDTAVGLVRRWASHSRRAEPLKYDPAGWEASYPGARAFSEDRDRQQAHLVLGYPGINSEDEDLEALYLLTAILGGQGGRLFRDLRDAQSLAYSVTAWSSASPLGGDIGAYIATSADKVDVALEGLRRHFKLVKADGVTELELQRARRHRIGARDVASQKRGTRASQMVSDVLFGLGQGYGQTFAERLERVTTEDIKRVANRLIRDDGEVVSIIQPGSTN